MSAASVTFGDYNSYEAWGLRLKEIEIGLPEPDTYYVEIPGRNGYLDLMSALTGRTGYKMRTILFTFDALGCSYTDWSSLISDVAAALHGQSMEISVDSDPGYYYEGRCTVSTTKSNAVLAEVVCECYCNPFKWETDLTVYTQTLSATASSRVLVTGGKDVSKQSWNTDWRYGTANIPTYDFSLYQSIYISLVSGVSGTVRIQFVDGSGNVYNATAVSSAVRGVSYTYSVSISTLEDAGLDPATIYRILLSGASSATVYVDTYNSVTMTVEGGTRNTVPELEVSSGVTAVAINGASYALDYGWNRDADMTLEAGENTLVFSGSFTTATIEISYRRGWL